MASFLFPYIYKISFILPQHPLFVLRLLLGPTYELYPPIIVYLLGVASDIIRTIITVGLFVAIHMIKLHKKWVKLHI